MTDPAFPFDDTDDFALVRRGLIAPLEPGLITDARGRTVWDADAWSFLDGDAPPTVHPSLWRQSQLVAPAGLYEVVPGIYQGRGFDLSNITFVEGDSGVIVIDPLISTETAAAALALYRAHRGDRPVTGVIYTHSHVDHFGGVKGVLSEADAAARSVPIVAPAGFMEHAISENVYAGVAMARRAGYMYGAALDRGPRGAVGAGLGQTTSTGTVTLIPPTDPIQATGDERVVDGVRMVFQLAPGSEAPAEMHFFFPERRALCVAENATHTLHNILTIRGAVVRDAHAWAGYLSEAVELFGEEADVVFASHHWPIWGRDDVVRYLSLQRDLYAYLHDQTVRLLNRGLTGSEIAEDFRLPPALEAAWHAHGYYGSVSHNVKAIYQRYMGWYDGNPTRLWQLPPAESSRRYVEAMGGADAVVDRARAALDAGELRWAAELLDRIVFAEPAHAGAREALADTLERLGFGAENGTWRNAFLSGAAELRSGSFGTPTTSASEDIVASLSPTLLLDAFAMKIDGPRAWDLDLASRWVFPDTNEEFRVTLRNGVLSAVPHGRGEAALTLTVPRAAIAALAVGSIDGARSAGLILDGDPEVLDRMLAVLDPGDPDFAIIQP
jgi:alkyl sulfatase BDS1-like metallo-beta-lactamase superfamily hydrolase